jgi:hypothetical protein
MSSKNENKTERVQLLMSPSEVEAIDDWGFNNRVRTRAEAMRRLCLIGLSVDSLLSRLALDARDFQRLFSDHPQTGNLKNLNVENFNNVKDNLSLTLHILIQVISHSKSGKRPLDNLDYIREIADSYNNAAKRKPLNNSEIQDFLNEARENFKVDLE